jgi:hypothetical protein
VLVVGDVVIYCQVLLDLADQSLERVLDVLLGDVEGLGDEEDLR